MTPTSPTIPPDVVRNVELRWPGRGHEWASRVAEELRELCRHYHATPREVLPARYGYVVAADTIHGGLVLRATPDPDGPYQAQVAGALADLGIGPTVHEAITHDAGTWTVSDEIRPATPLGDAAQSRVTLDSLVTALKAIDTQPAPSTAMRSIVDWLRVRLEEDHTTDLAPGLEPAPEHVRRGAVGVLDQLAANAVPRLCHGDLTPWNILAHGATGWMLIDPRGMSGEVGYDIAVLSLKVSRRGRAGLSVVLLADAVGVDPDRAQQWMVVAEAARV